MVGIELVGEKSDRLSYSIERLAEETDIGRTTIYQEVRDGRLVARKIRDRTVVLTEDALAWLRSAPPLPAGKGGDVADV